MNNRGYAYIMALFCLVLVSAMAFLWQQQLQSYSRSVSDAWSRTIADQAALSGLEYGLALIKSRKTPSKSLRIAVPGGNCKLRFMAKQSGTTIHSEASVYVLGRPQKAIRIFSVGK